MTATPESIAEKYAASICRGFTITDSRIYGAVLSAIREALAPVVAERDAARAELAMIERDRDRLDWLLQQGLAWNGHQQYDKNWLPGEWLYEMCSFGGARNEIDKARHAAMEQKGNANA